jgi:hypothetical protein
MSKSVLFSLVLFCWCVTALQGQDPARQKSIEERLLEMQERYERRIAALEGEVKALREESTSRPDDDSAALDRAIAELPPPPKGADLPGFQVGPARVNLLDVSMDVLFAAGTSTERDPSLQTLQGGAHDPKKRGFTLQNAELSLVGAVDPYFTGEVHVIFQIDPIEGETIVELEEAFLTTTSLPCGLQVEAGQMFTEFGRINAQHPHRWDFLDQPVALSRFFGGDGMRAPGVRVGWLPKLPWFCEFHASAQNANGETMTSFFANDEVFEERPIGGRPFVEQDVRDFGDLVYLLRVDNAVDLNECTTIKFGASGLFGPNATGPDGYTFIYGADLLMKYRPKNHRRGWPFVTWQSEILFRDYQADDYFDAADPADPLDDVVISGETLEDWGFYTQLLFGITEGWIAGVRYEYASGTGSNVDLTGALVARSTDPFRDDRDRFSALITYLPSEFSRLRLQYNYDVAQHLDSDAHSIWFGIEFLFGKHPAHTY